MRHIMASVSFESACLSLASFNGPGWEGQKSARSGRFCHTGRCRENARGERQHDATFAIVREWHHVHRPLRGLIGLQTLEALRSTLGVVYFSTVDGRRLVDPRAFWD